MFDLFENPDICANIVSYSSHDYLFIATINKTFCDSHPPEKKTSFNNGLYSPSRVDESTDSGFEQMLNVYKHAIRLDRAWAVEQLYENRLCIDIRECFVDSILYQRPDIFTWVCPKCDPDCDYWFNLAAQFGRIKYLEILKSLNFKWGPDTTLSAAEFGKLNGLMWLYDNGCPMDERVIVRSAVKGYEEIIVWCSGIIYDPPVAIN